MSQITELIHKKRHHDLWQLCCGFLDMSVDEIMEMQQELLLEQLALLRESRLGRKIMAGAMPETVEEFRNSVPLTTYTDYCPDLLEKDESGLPSKPLTWIQTSGKFGQYACKWIPVSRRFWDEASLAFGAIAILSTCKARGDIAFKPDFRLLHAASLTPYLTGHVAEKIKEDIGFKFLPSLDECQELSFEERVEKGFKFALEGGMDGFFGLGGILVGIGEKIRQSSGKSNLKPYLSHPKVAYRILRGLYRAKKEKRHVMPKDLWDSKIIVSMGTDSLVYQDRIRELWGKTPFNVYGNSESVLIATQTWDYHDMVFFPNLNFLEFIPMSEYVKWQIDNRYQPKTVLLNELQEQETYELVITNFHGGVMVRYRLGEMIRVTRLRNDQLNINLPQICFERRVDDLIDLGFMRLNERVIGQSLENGRVPYRDWVARKEISTNPRLSLYVELNRGCTWTANDVAKVLYDEIKKIDDGLYVHRDLPSLEHLIDFKPIHVTLLSHGTFTAYKEAKRKDGGDIFELKPPRINPPDEVLARLWGEDPVPASKAEAAVP